MSDETKVYLGTFKKATSKGGLEYYYGTMGAGSAVLFPTKDGSGLNMYVSERKQKDDRPVRQESVEKQLGDKIPF